ncbi:hypothetical protein [Oceanibium sediminis]|uniref:hypothetical protein n=1 Tax=Oceanibium sediminis TaxID=2026339 RepID=UPI000DD41B57|nr:hypothetical protein [Oceanibium sediminis]
MNRPFLILVALIAAYAAYAQYGDRLPRAGGGALLDSDGRAPPAAPAIVSGGAEAAAQKLAD